MAMIAWRMDWPMPTKDWRKLLNALADEDMLCGIRGG